MQHKYSLLAAGTSCLLFGILARGWITRTNDGTGENVKDILNKVKNLEERVSLAEGRIFDEQDECIQLPRHPRRIVDNLKAEQERIEKVTDSREKKSCKPPEYPDEVPNRYSMIVYNEAMQESGTGILLTSQGHAIVPANLVTDQYGTYSTQRGVIIQTRTQLEREGEEEELTTKIASVRDIEQVLAVDWSTNIALVRVQTTGQEYADLNFDQLCFVPEKDLSPQKRYIAYGRGISGDNPQIARPDGKPILANKNPEDISLSIEVGKYGGKTAIEAYPDTATSDLVINGPLQGRSSIIMTPQGRIAGLEVGRQSEQGILHIATAQDIAGLLNSYKLRLMEEDIRQKFE